MVSEQCEDSAPHSVYDTLVGTFIIFSEDDVKIEIYESVEGTGTLTDVVKLKYDDERGLRTVLK